MFSLIGCGKSSISKVQDEQLRLRQGDSIRYSLGNFPTEGSITISKQARNYTISRITMDKTVGGAIYEYVPTSNFAGQDYLEIVRADSDGSKKISEKTIRITITVE